MRKQKKIIGYCIYCGKKTDIAPFLCFKHHKIFQLLFESGIVETLSGLLKDMGDQRKSGKKAK